MKIAAGLVYFLLIMCVEVKGQDTGASVMDKLPSNFRLSQSIGNETGQSKFREEPNNKQSQSSTRKADSILSALTPDQLQEVKGYVEIIIAQALSEDPSIDSFAKYDIPGLINYSHKYPGDRSIKKAAAIKFVRTLMLD